MSSKPKTSKRDRFSKWLKSSSSHPVRASAASSRAPSPIHTSTPPRTSILEDALKRLDHEKEKTIRGLLPPGSVEFDAAFDAAHGRATELRQLCAKKTLKWTYKGRQIYLHDQVDKVLQFLDKFKSVGDVIANVDPVHVGLPWAGVRTILEVSMCSSTSICLIAL